MLKGEDAVRLTAEPGRLAELIKKSPQVKRVELWEQPFQALADEATIPIGRTDAALAAEFEPFAEEPVVVEGSRAAFPRQ